MSALLQDPHVVYAIMPRVDRHMDEHNSPACLTLLQIMCIFTPVGICGVHTDLWQLLSQAPELLLHICQCTTHVCQCTMGICQSTTHICQSTTCICQSSTQLLPLSVQLQHLQSTLATGTSGGKVLQCLSKCWYAHISCCGVRIST